MSNVDYNGPSDTDLVLSEVRQERSRQNEKWGQQHHPDYTEDDFGPVVFAMNNADDARKACEHKFEDGKGSWFDISREEFWEAIDEARAGNKKALRKELIQLAAVCVAWVEDLDRHE